MDKKRSQNVLTQPAANGHETEVPADSDDKLWLLSPSTKRDWQAFDPNSRETDEVAGQFFRTLTDLLQSQNLVVLSGLGTSLYLKSETGVQIAPTMTSLWDEASKFSGFEAILTKVNYPKPASGKERHKDIELLLSHCQLFQLLQTDATVQKFIAEAETLIVNKCRFVTPSMPLLHHESFLRKVARRSTRMPRMKLFTTNYDLCFETAASRARFVVVDGFSHTQPQEFDGTHFDYDFVRRSLERETPDYIPNVFHLYKIHGSVDWETLSNITRRNPDAKKPHLIYPRHTKYESSYDQPFLEMMSRLQIALRQPNTGLLVIGFGFNDFHLTQPIMAAVEANVGLKCMIVSPSLQEASQPDTDKSNINLSRIASLIREGDLRLSLLASGFEDFAPLVPDLVAKTEDEEHRIRLRSASTKQ